MGRLPFLVCGKNNICADIGCDLSNSVWLLVAPLSGSCFLEALLPNSTRSFALPSQTNSPSIAFQNPGSANETHLVPQLRHRSRRGLSVLLCQSYSWPRLPAQLEQLSLQTLICRNADCVHVLFERSTADDILHTENFHFVAFRGLICLFSDFQAGPVQR